MCRKGCSFFDLFVFFLLVVLCQTLYRMHIHTARPFVPLFATVVQEDTTFIKKELSRFFLYLSNILKPSQQEIQTPPLLTQLDILSSQLGRAYQITHQDRYTIAQRQKYQKELSDLINEVEKTGHEYLSQKSSARLLTPQGLSCHIAGSYEDAKQSLLLTQQTHRLLETMQSIKEPCLDPILSIEEGLQKNEELLQQLSR